MLPVQIWTLLAAIPPEVAGLPTWALNGLSIGSLVTLIVTGLATSRLWTKRQVDELVKQHEAERSRTKTDHDREMSDMKDRYELHLTRTVEMWQGRTTDALGREKEWRDVARQWEQTASLLVQGLEPLQDQSEAMLRIVSAWQAEIQRRGLGT